MDSLNSYLVIAAMLFSMGIYGIITRKNAVAILMGIELILNSANINFIAFNRFNGLNNLDGHVFAIFVMKLWSCRANMIETLHCSRSQNVSQTLLSMQERRWYVNRVWNQVIDDIRFEFLKIYVFCNIFSENLEL